MIEQDSYSLASYPKVYALGHTALYSLFNGPVVIEEKIDGSQFSFGRFNGELRCRSKNRPIDVDGPMKMFAAGVEAIKELPLHDGWTYRGEYLRIKHHNVITYDRVPPYHVILFDINTGKEAYISRKEKEDEAARLGLDIVPCMFEGEVDSSSFIQHIVSTQKSCLGDVPIEGVVIKNYNVFSQDGKALMGKYVSEAFKEVHQQEWKAKNPTSKDVINTIIEQYKSPMRWHKAVMRRKENGELLQQPADIGPLLKDINLDIIEECKEEIQEILWKWAWKHIQRGVTAGFPQWYKDQLLHLQFNENKGEEVIDNSLTT